MKQEYQRAHWSGASVCKKWKHWQQDLQGANIVEVAYLIGETHKAVSARTTGSTRIRIASMASRASNVGDENAAAALPKSILKKISKYGGPLHPETPIQPSKVVTMERTPSSPGLPTATSRDAHHRALAIHHATLIQQRKDVEASIFAAIESMLDFPSSHTTDPRDPAASDIRQVQELMNPFQPTDFDSLVEERNIDGKCGYVLCPRPHRVEKTKAAYRLLSDRGGGSDSFRIVKKKDLEMWCSDDCGKHALYLRVQLSETPAWERAGRKNSELEVYGQNRKNANSTEEVERLANGLDQLALERGDKSSNSFRASTVHVDLQERNHPAEQAPQSPLFSGDHNAVEGYSASSKLKRKDLSARLMALNMDDADDDMIDTI